jgi:hypothetical protein
MDGQLLNDRPLGRAARSAGSAWRKWHQSPASQSPRTFYFCGGTSRTVLNNSVVNRQVVSPQVLQTGPHFGFGSAWTTADCEPPTPCLPEMWRTLRLVP